MLIYEKFRTAVLSPKYPFSIRISAVPADSKIGIRKRHPPISINPPCIISIDAILYSLLFIFSHPRAFSEKEVHHTGY